MFVEMAIGDAYGVRFEGCDADYTARQNNLTYRPDPKILLEHPEDTMMTLVYPGRYTDDTQMSLAIAEAMLDDNEPWTKESLAERFVQVFRRDERRGYTTYFLNVLMNSTNGKEMLSRINGKSTKSGAFMRAAPLGLYERFDMLLDRAQMQAMVTHDSEAGKGSAIGAAMMVHYFYHDLGPKHELSGWMRDRYFGDTIMTPHPVDLDGEKVMCWSPRDKRRVRVHGWDCLHAAIYAVEESETLSDVLKVCATYGGDVDTVSAVAMAAASWSREIEQTIPRVLCEELENGKYGRGYLEDLDRRLVSKFPPLTP